MTTGRKFSITGLDLGLSLLLAALFYIFARIALLLAIPPGYAVAFWPSAGLALAVVLFYGYRAIPGILLGALATNLHILSVLNQMPLQSSLLPAAGIATGAALQAAFGSWLIRRYTDGPWDLAEFRQTLYVVILGSPVTSLVSASVGTSVLMVTSGTQVSFHAYNWLTWWLSNWLGIFVVTPVALMWLSYMRDSQPLRRNIVVTVPLLVMFFVTVGIYNMTKSNAVSRLAEDSALRAATLADYLLGQLSNQVHAAQGLASLVSAETAGSSDAGARLDRYMAAYPAIQGAFYIDSVDLAGDENLPLVTAETIREIRSSETALPLLDQLLRSAAVGDAVRAAVAGGTPVLVSDNLPDSAGGYWLVYPELFGDRMDVFLVRLDFSGIFENAVATTQPEGTMLVVRVPQYSAPLLKWPGDFDERRWQEAAQLGLATRTVSLQDHQWTIELANSPERIGRSVKVTLWLVLSAGFALVGCVGFMAITSSGYRLDAKRQIALKTRELQNEQAFLDTLIESMPLILYVKDAQTRQYLRFNKAAFELFNAPVQDYVGKTREQLFSGKIRGQDTKADDIVIESGEIYDEMTEFVHKGVSHWFRSKKVPIKDEDGNVVYILGLAEDITEEVGTKKGLVESRRHLALILDNVGEGIFGIDTAGRCTFVNPAARKLLRRGEEELLGTYIHEVIHYRYKDGTPYPSDRCPILRALDDREVREISHEVFWRSDGSNIPVEYVCTPIIEDEAVIGAVVVFSDITRRQTLEQLQKEHTQRLEQINQELEEFSYIASHDIQEPLRTLNCFCEFLADDLGPELPERARTDIHYITEASQRMQVLINEMLEYSRAGRTPLDMNEVSPNRCIDNVRKDLLLLIRETHTTLLVDQLPLVMGDESKLTRVFQNLIHNAIKFRGEKEPVIEIREVEAPDDEFVTIAIKDNGIGIETQFHQQIFGAFKRLHTSDRYPGSGIGLAMVKKIVDRHGGSITLESEPGAGTTFFVRLRKAVVNKPI